MHWTVLRDECLGLAPDLAAMRTLEFLRPVSLPIPIIEFIPSLGITLKVEPSDGMEGGLEWGSPPTLFINSLNNMNRKRFTCAHELAHLLIHPKGNYLDETHDKNGYHPTEQEANTFAAHLLMPIWKLEELVLRRVEVNDLLRVFGVSSAALNWQLQLLR